MEININIDGVLLSANNLSDVASAAASRINIGAEPLIAAGVNTQYWRGDKTWQTLNTTAVSEGINLYYTQARFDTAFAAKTTTNLNEGINLYFTEDKVRDTDLAGLSITGGSIGATDTVLEAFGKLQNQIAGLLGGAIVQGVWNATTNTPALASGVGTTGYYYVVNVAGSTNLDGITDWKVGDWAIFINGAWNKVDNTDAVSSVNGYVGAVSLVKADIGLGNVENTALSTWAGSTNLVTLGAAVTGAGSLTLGTSSSVAGTLVLKNATNAFTQTIRGTNPSASIIYDLPTTAPTAGQVLQSTAPVAGVATLSWATASSGITVGTTTITSGTDTRIPFNDAGVYGEDAGLTWNKTTNILTTTGGFTTGTLTFKQTTINNIIIGGTTSTNPSTIAISSTGIGSSGCDSGVIIGEKAGIGGAVGNHAVLVGFGACRYTATGVGGIGIGRDASPAHDGSIVIAYGATTTATHQGILGAPTASGYVDNWYFNGVTHTSAYAVALNACGGSGTNNAGANLTLAAGKGTGAGTPGTWSVQTSATLGTGTTLQSLVTRLTISGGAVTTDASTATWADKLDFVFNTGTGTKLGTATTQKLAFWNATPIVQPSSANQAALTNSTGGTYNGTLVDVGAVFSQANINDNFTDICTLLNEVRNVLVNTGLMKGSA